MDDSTDRRTDGSTDGSTDDSTDDSTDGCSAAQRYEYVGSIVWYCSTIAMLGDDFLC